MQANVFMKNVWFMRKVKVANKELSCGLSILFLRKYVCVEENKCRKDNKKTFIHKDDRISLNGTDTANTTHGHIKEHLQVAGVNIRVVSSAS